MWRKRSSRLICSQTWYRFFPAEDVHEHDVGAYFFSIRCRAPLLTVVTAAFSAKSDHDLLTRNRIIGEQQFASGYKTSLLCLRRGIKSGLLAKDRWRGQVTNQMRHGTVSRGRY